MSARNKQRGYELEKETADFWQGHGFDCHRVFGSGAYKTSLATTTLATFAWKVFQ